ncbi:MAG: hypothetical protein CME64_16965 [Halobacteriovoraceae bacterium]|nr:hypothetical protein [Halobacteriovoraceae bacterium]
MRIAFITLLLSLSCFASVNFKAHVAINGVKDTTVDPGAPIAIEIFFSNPQTQKVYKEFHQADGKLMHLVLVKNDLSTFKKVYPYFDPASGIFRITLNTPHSDTDNLQASKALHSPGRYFFIAQVHSTEGGLFSSHFSLNASGDSTKTPIDLDPIDADMTITKYFGKEEKSSLPYYKAKLSHKTTSVCKAIANEFTLEISVLDEDTNKYLPIKDTIQILGKDAQAVWLSSTLASGHTSHHAIFSGSAANERLVFKYHDQGTLLPGVQKVWFQIKHEGRLITMPFVFEYNPEPVTGDNC